MSAAENPFTIRGDHRMKDFDPESATGRGSIGSWNENYITWC